MGEVDGIPVVAVDFNPDRTFNVTLKNGVKYLKCYLKSYIAPPRSGVTVEQINIDTKDLKISGEVREVFTPFSVAPNPFKHMVLKEPEL